MHIYISSNIWYVKTCIINFKNVSIINLTHQILLSSTGSRFPRRRIDVAPFWRLFFSAFTRGRATQILTMTFIAVMRNGRQTGSSSREAHSVSDNFSKHANRVRLSERKSLREGRVLLKRSHRIHYQDTGLRIITWTKNMWRNNFCVYNDVIRSIKCLTGNFVTSRYQLIHDDEQKQIFGKK